jgi:mono/diheme cytochrome c family protein
VETEKRTKFFLLKLAVCLSAMVLFGPASVLAHGWKAPAKPAERENPVAANAASIEKGKTLFLDQCAGCHGRNATGNGPMASALNPAPSDLVEVSGHHPDGDFFWKIENGRGSMPGFGGRLTDEQIWHLVNYIQSLKPAH